MESKLEKAKKLFLASATKSEQEICQLAIKSVNAIHLDENCVLSCYLYYPYIKTAVYQPPSSEEQKSFDEVRRRQEENKKREIEEQRQAFKEKLALEFGEDVVSFLHALKKLLEIDYKNEEEEAENIRKMFFALAKDVRVILVKICFVLAEIKYFSSAFLDEGLEDVIKAPAGDKTSREALGAAVFAQNEKFLERATKKAKQILDLFAPLAARLGLSSIKSELEDIAFEMLNPEVYSQIKREVDKRYIEREKTVEDLKVEIKKFMRSLGLSGEIMGRKKHIYSIYKKLKEKGGDMDKIYDLVAVRAILNSVADCYALLGKINENFMPLQNRFKDYISIPKSNGYQSLHTTIMFEGVPVEIQIRTLQVHRMAEFGVAAHWMYKEKRQKQDSLDERLGWVREIMENEKNMTSEELISSLKVDIYDGEIFVQTPKGKVLHMVENSTPIDFAYMIHSEVGNQCVGAKVNGKMWPITKPLSNGDIVEIITNPNSKGPSRDWLKVVKTSQAKNKILSFFRKEMKEENIKNGKAMFEQAIKNLGYSVSKVTEKKYEQKLLEKYNFSEIDELFASIGYGAYSAKVFAGKLIQIYQADVRKEQEKLQIAHIDSQVAVPSDKKVNVKGLNNLMVKFAKCCCPIEGDDIIGFISQGRGIIVHRKQCPNVAFFDSDRLIEVDWQQEKEEK